MVRLMCSRLSISARMVSISLIMRVMAALCSASLSSSSLSLGLSSVSTRLRLVAIAFSRSVTFFSSTAPGVPAGHVPDFRNERTRSYITQRFEMESWSLLLPFKLYFFFIMSPCTRNVTESQCVGGALFYFLFFCLPGIGLKLEVWIATGIPGNVTKTAPEWEVFSFRWTCGQTWSSQNKERAGSLTWIWAAEVHSFILTNCLARVMVV